MLLLSLSDLCRERHWSVKCHCHRNCCGCTGCVGGSKFSYFKLAKKWQNHKAISVTKCYSITVQHQGKQYRETYNKVVTSAVECCSHQLSCLDLKLSSSSQSRTEYLSISCWEGGRGAKEGGEMEGWTEGRGGR